MPDSSNITCQVANIMTISNLSLIQIVIMI